MELRDKQDAEELSVAVRGWGWGVGVGGEVRVATGRLGGWGGVGFRGATTLRA